MREADRQVGAVRVLVWGSVSGAFASFAANVRTAVERYGAFDLCACVGSFFGDINFGCSTETTDVRKLIAQLREVLPTDIPIPRVLIAERTPRPDALGAILQSAYPEGLPQLTEQFSLLPINGLVTTEHGLRIASWSPPPAGLRTEGRSKAGHELNMTVCDVCFLTAWPEGIEVGLSGPELHKYQQLVLTAEASGSPTDDPAVRRAAYLFLRDRILTARYVISGGPPSVFYQRPPFRRLSELGVQTRFISIGDMIPPNADSDGVDRKFCHSLRLVPWGIAEPNLPAARSSSDVEPGPLPLLLHSRRRQAEGPVADQIVKRRREESSVVRPVNMSFNTPIETEPAQAMPSPVRTDELVTRKDAEDAFRRSPPRLTPATAPTSAASPVGNSGSGPVILRPFVTGRPSSVPHVRVLYVSNVPYAAQVEDLRRCFTAFGKVEDVRMPKGVATRPTGRAWVTFTSAAGAAAALAAPKVLLSGRQLRLVVANRQEPPRQQPVWESESEQEQKTASVPGWESEEEEDDEEDDEEPEEPSWRKADERSSSSVSASSLSSTEKPAAKFSSPQVDVRPHEDCWFCLYNPNCERSLIISVGTGIYVALSRGGIVEDHVMMLPVSHQPSLATCPPDVQEEIQTFCSAIEQHFARVNQSVVFFERHVPMKYTKGMHTQLHAVPVSPLSLEQFRHEMMRTAATDGLALEKIDRYGVSGLAENLKKRNANGAMPPYWYIDIPRAGSLCMYRESYVGVGNFNTRLNVMFAREVLCRVLGEPNRVSWKACVLPRSEEERAAKKLRELLAPSLPKADQEKG